MPDKRQSSIRDSKTEVRNAFKPEGSNPALSVLKAARRFNVTRQRLYQLIESGSILDPRTNEPVKRGGGATLIPLTDDGKIRITNTHKPAWAEGHAPTNPRGYNWTGPTISTTEASQVLGVSPRQVRWLVAEQRILIPGTDKPIPLVGKGGRTRIPVDAEGKPVVLRRLKTET